jgi:hypothetical protein
MGTRTPAGGPRVGQRKRSFLVKFEFKSVRRTIRLAEYALELEPAEISVQVNVSREVIERMLAVNSETKDAEFFGILQELWDDRNAPSGATGSWPIEDIEALRKHCAENDPQLWRWIVKQTWDLVIGYRSESKKA